MKPMKQYITLFALQLIVIAGWAQKLTVEGMTLVEDDQSAVMEKRTDIGGNPCALVKQKVLHSAVTLYSLLTTEMASIGCL